MLRKRSQFELVTTHHKNAFIRRSVDAATPFQFDHTTESNNGNFIYFAYMLSITRKLK